MTEQPIHNLNCCGEMYVSAAAPSTVPIAAVDIMGTIWPTGYLPQYVFSVSRLTARAREALSTTAWVGGINRANTGTAVKAKPKPVKARITAANTTTAHTSTSSSGDTAARMPDSDSNISRAPVSGLATYRG